jgi:tetratricopeptide (TPR) repeat protein
VNKRFEEALVYLDRAIEVDPQDPWPRASRGAALYSLDHYAEALDSLDQALALQPNYPWAYCLKAAVLSDVDELVAARENIDHGIALDDSMAWAWGISGWLHILAATGPRDDEAAHRAVADYSRALAISDGAQMNLPGPAH